MASFYPHKQTLFIILICILAVGGTAAYANRSKLMKTAEEPVIVSTSPVKEEVLDSSEWKKSFFAATDGTKLPVTPQKEREPRASDEPLTLTDQIGRDFFTNYLRLKQTGLTTNETVVGDAASYMLDSTLAAADQPVAYSPSNLIIGSDSTETGIRAYGNAVGYAFMVNAPRTDPATIALQAFEDGDMEKLSAIDPIIAGYSATNRSLLAITVPASMADMHMTLVNSISSMLYVAQGLRVADKDPMRAMIALGTYTAAHASLQESLLALKEYFNGQSVLFAANEPGTAFSTI